MQGCVRYPCIIRFEAIGIFCNSVMPSYTDRWLSSIFNGLK